MVLNCECEWIWKETIVGCFKAISQNTPGENEEVPGQLIARLKFEHNSSVTVHSNLLSVLPISRKCRV
jgi:hypothetical protein